LVGKKKNEGVGKLVFDQKAGILAFKWIFGCFRMIVLVFCDVEEGLRVGN
jgi:hypothetical protein